MRHPHIGPLPITMACIKLPSQQLTHKTMVAYELVNSSVYGDNSCDRFLLHWQYRNNSTVAFYLTFVCNLNLAIQITYVAIWRFFIIMRVIYPPVRLATIRSQKSWPAFAMQEGCFGQQDLDAPADGTQDSSFHLQSGSNKTKRNTIFVINTH